MDFGTPPPPASPVTKEVVVSSPGARSPSTSPNPTTATNLILSAFIAVAVLELIVLLTEKAIFPLDVLVLGVCVYVFVRYRNRLPSKRWHAELLLLLAILTVAVQSSLTGNRIGYKSGYRAGRKVEIENQERDQERDKRIWKHMGYLDGLLDGTSCCEGEKEACRRVATKMTED